jgi:hypothetical protein
MLNFFVIAYTEATRTEVAMVLYCVLVCAGVGVLSATMP